MDIVFMGTPEFSVPILESLIAAGHNVKAAVTQADKPKGRGRQLYPTPVKAAALEHGIEVYQPLSIKKDDDFFQTLSRINPDAIVVAAYGQILPKRILELPKYGCINVHASLLPKLRGAAPIQTAIINGDKIAGVTTMLMDVGLDTGDMYEKAEIVLDDDETGGSLHDKLSELGAKLIVTTLAGIEAGTLTPVKQDDALATYAGMLNKKMGKIDFKMSAGEIERLVRGLYPWPGTYTVFRGKLLKILKADVMTAEDMVQIVPVLSVPVQSVPVPSVPVQSVPVPSVPGTVVEVSKNYIAVQTGKNLLMIKELQLEGKGRMKADEFLRGYKIEKSERLGDD